MEFRAHRLAYELFKGKIPKGLNVIHHCDTRACVNPKHLFLGDIQAAVDNKMRKGRWKGGDQGGEKNPRCKLSEDKVKDIKIMIDAGLNNMRIADLYDVTHSNISAIKLGKSWA